MAQLAIRGHATRGDEVISILKMLGGKLRNVVSGDVTCGGYYINSNGYIDYGYANFLDNIVIYTLDEFLEKFPYKVGDKVVYENKKREITKMGWEERTNTVAYKLDDKLYCNVIDELQPYKEENMEKITDKAIAPVLTGEDLAYNRFGYKIPNGYEFDCIKNNEIIIKPKQPQYPKTYKECCDVLGLNTLDNDAQGI